ncbi:MAG: hypothetical protein WC600_02625 [Desulfobaccales bacterium]
MPRACQICNHPERLAIEREIVSGKSKTLISRTYGVSTDSIANHQESHLSRQLTQAWTRKSGLEVMGLMADIEDLVSKARLIFDRNFEKNSTAGDLTALNALREQRGVFELLVKIAALYHEARLLELQGSQDHLEQEQQARTKEGMSRLTFEEVEALLYLTRKMDGAEVPDADIPAIFKAPAPRTLPPPLPRPKTPPTTDSKPVYADDLPDPGDSPGEPEQEPETVPEPKPRSLPPQHVTEIGEASRAEQKQFVNELRGGNVRVGR